ncbi:MAG: hypothetical protein QXO70_04550 [Candidatus Pacearchaeota archaeon]
MESWNSIRKLVELARSELARRFMRGDQGDKSEPSIVREEDAKPTIKQELLDLIDKASRKSSDQLTAKEIRDIGNKLFELSIKLMPQKLESYIRRLSKQWDSISDEFIISRSEILYKNGELEAIKTYIYQMLINPSENCTSTTVFYVPCGSGIERLLFITTNNQGKIERDIFVDSTSSTPEFVQAATQFGILPFSSRQPKTKKF